jgi:hypothetical protein
MFAYKWESPRQGHYQNKDMRKVIVKLKSVSIMPLPLGFIWLENRPIEVEELFKMELFIQKTKCASSPLRFFFVL